MENRGFELADTESMEIIRDQVLERMATSNLKAIDGYIAYHPTDEDARVIRSNSVLILSKIKAGRKMIFPRAAAPIGDIGPQVPNTGDEVPFEPPTIHIESEMETIQHICAMDRYRGISPEELRLSEYQLRQGVQICADECLHHICATDRYRGYSPEELRLNDYHQGHNLSSSSVDRAPVEALTEVHAPGQPDNTAQASGPRDSSAPAYLPLFNPSIIIID